MLSAPENGWAATVPAKLAIDMEQRAYRDGWWWGLASGAIVGTCSTALLLWLLKIAAAALGYGSC